MLLLLVLLGQKPKTTILSQNHLNVFRFRRILSSITYSIAHVVTCIFFLKKFQSATFSILHIYYSYHFPDFRGFFFFWDKTPIKCLKRQWFTIFFQEGNSLPMIDWIGSNWQIFFIALMYVKCFQYCAMCIAWQQFREIDFIFSAGLQSCVV